VVVGTLASLRRAGEGPEISEMGRQEENMPPPGHHNPLGLDGMDLRDVCDWWMPAETFSGVPEAWVSEKCDVHTLNSSKSGPQSAF
jgi:hypothetical protein